MADDKTGTGAADSQAAPPPSTPPATPPPAGSETPKPETGTAAADAPPASSTPQSTAAPEAKAPEKYEFVVPEAAKAYANPAVINRVTQIARANNMPNDVAQLALEEHLEAVRIQATTWETETQADPEFGGDHFSETQRLATKVIDRVRPQGHKRRDSFLSFLGSEGAGKNIDVVSFLADIGKLMSEDSPALGRGSVVSAPADASAFYDHPTSRALDDHTRR